MQQSAPTIKKLALELGGHAPFIVFDDADIDAAVEGALQSKYRNAGQTCVCTNRFYAHASIYDSFVEKLAAGAAKMTVGDGFVKGTHIGPLIDADAIAKVEDHVADAISKGARVITGGKAHALGGTFYTPTVLANVSSDMKIMHEETFGPVAAVMKFASEADVIAAANDTDFGLASYFMRAILAASGASPNSSTTAWSASIPASFPMKSRPLAASSNPVWGAKDPNTASTNISR